MIKKALLFLLAALLVLVLILAYNTWQLESRQLSPRELAEITIDSKAIDNLQSAVRIPTISQGKENSTDTAAFLALHDLIKERFPLVDSFLVKETVNDLSLLYTWEGSDASLQPAILMGHMDVVPVEESSRALWGADPFGGELIDGYIYGRGTLDDKLNVMGYLQAAEHLLAEGFIPKRTLYFAFGHDEEMSGKYGAAEIASILKDRGVKAAFALDEGMLVTKGVLPGMDRPAAFIGVAEKGYLTVDLEVNYDGGHSSMPAPESAISILNGALAKLLAQPHPPTFSETLQGFIAFVGPELPFPLNMVFANTWLFKKVLFSQYEASNSGNALIRTTQAITIVEAGIKDNVIPTKAKATINHRLLPGENMESIVAKIEERIKDERVKISPRVGQYNAPSAVSSTESEAFLLLQQSITDFFPEAVVSPMLVLAATDSRYYYEVADDVYRFMPIVLASEDLSRIHGINERIKADDYLKSIQFYVYLIGQL